MKYIKIFMICWFIFLLASCGNFFENPDLESGETEDVLTDDDLTETPVYYTVTVDGVSQSVLEGEKAIEPETPIKEGYIFDKWMSNGEEFSFDTLIYQDYIIESTFLIEAVYYTVTVDGVSQKVLEGEKAIEPETPTKEGYTFEKWMSNGEEFTFDTIINQDYEITSSFTKNPVYYTVTVDGVSQKVLEGEKAIEPTIEVKEDYTFDKWLCNGEEFTFDTIINQDYVIESKWVLTLDITEETEEMNHLQGGFAKLNDNYVSKKDNSIGLFKNIRMNQGRISFQIKGAGGYGVYFDLDNEEIKRGRPTGNYYALKVDEFGNIYFIRANNGHEVTMKVSLVIKEDFSNQKAYHFEIARTNKTISIYCENALIISYVDNLPIEGYGFAVTASKKATEFTIDNYAPITTATVIDGVLNFADAGKNAEHLVLIDGTEYPVEQQNQLNLEALNLEDKVHSGSVYKVVDGVKQYLVNFEYATLKEVEGMTTYNGDFALYGNKYIYSQADYSMGLFDEQEFVNGNVKVKVIPGNNDDAGIVFRANTHGLTNFWEDSLAEYYVALININGIVLLGKVNYNGTTWTLLGSKALNGVYSPSNEYELEVRAYENRFMVLVDGVKYIDYVDENPFMGTQVGIRTTTKGTKFSNFEIYEPSIIGMTIQTYSDSITLNSEIDLDNIKAYIEYDNGALEEIAITMDMLSDVDTSTVGTKAITLSYENSVSSYEKVFYMHVTEEEYLYYKDFSTIADSSVLPDGWVPQQGNAVTSSYAIANGALNMSSLKTNFPVALQFEDLGTDNYTVEIEFDVTARMDTGRWVGITTRLQETAGWWKGSVGLNGTLAINNNTNTNLAKPTWVQAVNKATGVTIDFNTRHTLQLAVNGLEVGVYLDGTHYVTHTLPDTYATGGFGIVISGVTANFYKVAVRETKAADFNRQEGIVVNGPQAINQGDALDLEVTLTEASGAQKVLKASEYQVSGFDATKAGKQEVTVISGNYTATHIIEVLEKDVIETYYQMDLTKIDSTTKLPVGWTWRSELTSATYNTTSEGIKVSDLSKTPVVSLQYTDSSFTASDYSYEMQLKIVDYQNTSRWFGLTSRGTEAHGYIRTHLVLKGTASYGQQRNWFIGTNGNSKNSTSVVCGTIPAFTKGQVLTIKVVAYGMQFAFYLNNELLYIGNYADASFATGYDYSQGTFGFTFGGGEYLIQSVVVRSVSNIEKAVFSKGE